MVITKSLATCALAASAASAALGLAGPASAEPLNGSYTETVTGGLPLKRGVTYEVNLTPCGPDCTHWQITGAPQGFDMHLQGNRWTNPDGNVSFDKDSLEGTTTTTNNNGMTATNTFLLTKNG